MNVSDSERICAFLEKQGLRQAEKIDAADIVIFNTCGIRQAAENRAYGLINNLKESNPNIKIVLTGCLANRADVQKRMQGKVDLFCEIKDFQKEIEDMLRDTQRRDALQCVSTEGYLSIIPKHTSHFEASVPIMTGCNNFCSYCVVPYARGSEVSRPADEILTEIRTLVRSGYKMITLLGQNVNSYKSPSIFSSPCGRGCRVFTTGEGSDVNFATLLKKINAIPGKFWITFVSSHPKDMDDELIETIAKCKKVCEWIHLPIQAGDDEILRKMNRKYTQKQYLNKVRKIRKTFATIRGKFVPISVSTDIIVGFPGETKKQFLQSASVMEKAKFDLAYFGQFSPRPGTVAWKMKDNVSKEEKARRENVLNDILKKTALANNKKYIGKTVEVLIENEARPKGNLKDSLRFPLESYAYFGKTRTMKNVKITDPSMILPLARGGKPGSGHLIGSFAKVKITTANIWNLEGIIEKRGAIRKQCPRQTKPSREVPSLPSAARKR